MKRKVEMYKLEETFPKLNGIKEKVLDELRKRKEWLSEREILTYCGQYWKPLIYFVLGALWEAGYIRVSFSSSEGEYLFKFVSSEVTICPPLSRD